MRTPSIKTLRDAFNDRAPEAKRVLRMTRAQLLETPAGDARDRECLHRPDTEDLRMHALNALDPGFHGIETIRTTMREPASYLNTGDTYASTLIYWRGRYRVQCVGDFVETLERWHRARFE